MDGVHMPTSAAGVAFLGAWLVAWFIKRRAELWLEQQAAQREQDAKRAEEQRALERAQLERWQAAYEQQHEQQLSALRSDKARLEQQLDALRSAQGAELEQWKRLAQDALLDLKRLSKSDTLRLAQRARVIEGQSLPGLSLEELSDD